MNKIITLAGAILVGTILTGCTTAGPFITNISSDGDGNLIIEKSRVKFNAFTTTIANEGGTTHKIRISPRK